MNDPAPGRGLVAVSDVATTGGESTSRNRWKILSWAPDSRKVSSTCMESCQWWEKDRKEDNSSALCDVVPELLTTVTHHAG